MKELSLNILDIAENSVRAGAKHITISVSVQSEKDKLTILISDDGCGMSADLLARVRDPFTTTRTTRRVGLGIPLFEEAAECTGGALDINSTPGVGTTVTATFGLSSIDRMPLGDFAGTASTLIQCNADIRWTFRYEYDGRLFEFDTQELFEALEAGIPLSNPEISCWIKDYLSQHIDEVNGGNSI